MMKNIPNYVEQLLLRRMRLSNQLAKVNSQIDEYCMRIGIDDSYDLPLGTDIRIYCEVDAGIYAIRDAILRTLNARPE